MSELAKRPPTWLHSRHWRPGRHLAAHVLLLSGALVVVFPFVWQVLTSFKSFGESVLVPPLIVPHTWEPGNYIEVFRAIPFATMLATSIIVAVARTIAHVALCAMAAYAFARLEFPGRNALFIVYLSMLMVPYELLIIPQYEIVQGLGWLNSIQALIIPRLFSAFGVFLLRQFFLTLPKELEEAARIDGANAGRIFWNIMLPLAKPGLVALSILTILASWQDLLWPLVVNTDPAKMPLSAGLATLKGEYYSNYPVLMAGSLLAMLPVLVLFAIMQRQFIQGIAFTGLKG